MYRSSGTTVLPQDRPRRFNQEQHIRQIFLGWRTHTLPPSSPRKTELESPACPSTKRWKQEQNSAFWTTLNLKTTKCNELNRGPLYVNWKSVSTNVEGSAHERIGDIPNAMMEVVRRLTASFTHLEIFSDIQCAAIVGSKSSFHFRPLGKKMGGHNQHCAIPEVGRSFLDTLLLRL